MNCEPPMSLLDRIQKRETCAVVGCERHKETDSLFCREHLADMWANRLDRLPDGTFDEKRRFTARDETRGHAA